MDEGDVVHDGVVGPALDDPVAGLQGDGRAEAEEDRGGAATYKLLDTSVIIDGRISDICDTGFIEGILILVGTGITTDAQGRPLSDT